MVRFNNSNAAHIDMRMVRVRATRGLGDDDVLSGIPVIVDDHVGPLGGIVDDRALGAVGKNGVGDPSPGIVRHVGDPGFRRHVARDGDSQNDGEHDQNHQYNRDDFQQVPDAQPFNVVHDELSFATISVVAVAGETAYMKISSRLRSSTRTPTAPAAESRAAIALASAVTSRRTMRSVRSARATCGSFAIPSSVKVTSGNIPSTIFRSAFKSSTRPWRTSRPRSITAMCSAARSTCPI